MRIFVTISSSLLPLSSGAVKYEMSTITQTQSSLLTSIHDLPMVEHTLGEGLSGSMRPQFSIKSKGFGDREVCFNREHWRSWPLLLAVHLTTSLVEAAVNTTDGIFRALNFNCQSCQLPLKASGPGATYRDRRALGDPVLQAGKQHNRHDALSE